MKREFNSQAFTPEEVEKGKHLELIKLLLSLEDKDSFEDIHIASDGYCVIVEWDTVFRDERPVAFRYTSDDEVILKEVIFPDNHIEYAGSEEEAKEMLDKWLKENPQWHKNYWGMWTDAPTESDGYDLRKAEPEDESIDDIK